MKNLIGKQSLVSAVSGLFSILITWLFLIGPIERLNIDLLNYFFPSKANSDDVVVVAIDEQSFSAFDKQWPWPREFHAALIDRLKEEGAKEIIFDVQYS